MIRLIIILIISPLLFANSVVLNEYKKLVNTGINDCIYDGCKKIIIYTLDDIHKYINSLKLNDFIRVNNSNKNIVYYNANFNIKRDRNFLNNVIKLHNDIVDSPDNAVLKGLPYEILQYLIGYTIKHGDVYLFNAITNGMISDGDGEYAQAFNEEAYIPLLLNFPNVDNRLSKNDIYAYAPILFHDWVEVNPGTLEDYKKMSKQIKKQSLRLYKSLEMYLRGMILVMKFKITFDEFNKIIDVEENTKYFTKLLIKYNLLEELNRYK